MLEFAVAARSIRGARPYQEDFRLVWLPGGCESNGGWRGPSLLAVVADGMGGHAGGRQASRLAATWFVKAFDDAYRARQGKSGELIPWVDEATRLLRSGIEAANAAIGAAVRREPHLSGMGSTIVAGYFDQDGLRWASVGDSKLWIMTQGELRRANADHSYGALLDELAARRQISQQDAESDPRRNALRSALTGEKLDLTDEQLQSYTLRPGDWVLLASDGVDTIDSNAIKNILLQFDGSARDAVVAITAAVEKLRLPHQDNATIVAIKVMETERGLLDKPAQSACSSSFESWLTAQLEQARSEDEAIAEERSAATRPLYDEWRQPLMVAAVCVIVIGLLLLATTIGWSSTHSGH